MLSSEGALTPGTPRGAAPMLGQTFSRAGEGGRRRRLFPSPGWTPAGLGSSVAHRSQRRSLGGGEREGSPGSRSRGQRRVAARKGARRRARGCAPGCAGMRRDAHRGERGRTMQSLPRARQSGGGAGGRLPGPGDGSGGAQPRLGASRPLLPGAAGPRRAAADSGTNPSSRHPSRCPGWSRPAPLPAPSERRGPAAPETGTGSGRGRGEGGTEPRERPERSRSPPGAAATGAPDPARPAARAHRCPPPGRPTGGAGRRRRAAGRAPGSGKSPGPGSGRPSCRGRVRPGGGGAGGRAEPCPRGCAAVPAPPRCGALPSRGGRRGGAAARPEPPPPGGGILAPRTPPKFFPTVHS